MVAARVKKTSALKVVKKAVMMVELMVAPKAATWEARMAETMAV